MEFEPVIVDPIDEKPIKDKPKKEVNVTPKGKLPLNRYVEMLTRGDTVRTDAGIGLIPVENSEGKWANEVFVGETTKPTHYLDAYYTHFK